MSSNRVYVTITDAEGVVLDRFEIIDTSTERGMIRLHQVEPGEEDAETESIPSPMAIASLVQRIQRAVAVAQ